MQVRLQRKINRSVPLPTIGIFVVVLSLALVPPAAVHDAAASTSGLAICGPNKSVEVRREAAQKLPVTYTSRLRAAAPALPQSFYKVQLNGSRSCNVSNPGAPIAFFVPAAGDIRILNAVGQAFWVRLSAPLTKLLRHAARRLKPFHAPTRLASATINDQSAAKPSTYLRLYTLGTPVPQKRVAGGWLPIMLIGSSTPWTDGNNRLWVSRRGSYVRRDGELVRITAAIAERIRRAAPIPG